MESRALLCCAAFFAALALASMAGLGTVPAAQASGEQVVVWFREHSGGVRWFVWVGTVSAPVFAAIVGLLCRLLPAPHRYIFLLGGASLVVTSVVQSWIWGGLALHADRLEPSTARTLLDVAVFYGPVLTGAWMTMIAPVTLLALRRNEGVPGWFGLLGVVVFTEQLIETVTIFGSTGFIEPGGAMNMQLGAGLTVAWLLAFALWAGLNGMRLDGPGAIGAEKAV